MRNFYHLSDEFLGDKVKFKPRVPKNRHDGEMFHPYLNKKIKEDGTIPRICCSNTIAGAIRAIYLCASGSLFVYRPVEFRAISRDLPLLLVNDAKTTGEHWILSSCKMEFLGEIRVNRCEKWRWLKGLTG